MNLLKPIALAAVLFTVVPVTAQTVNGPIAGNPVMPFTADRVGDLGYVTEEFFFSGQATSYVPVGELASDGNWSVKEGDKAAYTTRLVVVRPKDRAKFNGTVVLEWLNVSGGGDSGVDWNSFHRELLRSGYAYIGVSAQRVGIYGASTSSLNLIIPPKFKRADLKTADPVRYATLEHPGDEFSYDIFSQAGKLARDGKVLAGLKPRIMLATGESQSAVYLTAYVNAVDPLAKVFDGFLIHSRLGGSAKLRPELPATPETVKFRPDLRVPMLAFICETDLMYGYYRARVPDNDKIRVWEVAGTAHGDTYLMGLTQNDFGQLPAAELAKGYAPMRNALGEDLPPVNAAPQHHYVMHAALDALNRWVSKGKMPPEGALLEISTADPPAFRLDINGNVAGGVRSPWVDTPIATLSGVNASNFPGANATKPGTKMSISGLFGSTEYFDPVKLKQLYPGGRNEYLKHFNAALDQAVNRGFILKSDVSEIRALAAAMYPAS